MVEAVFRHRYLTINVRPGTAPTSDLPPQACQAPDCTQTCAGCTVSCLHCTVSRAETSMGDLERAEADKRTLDLEALKRLVDLVEAA